VSVQTEMWLEVWSRYGDPNFRRTLGYVPFRSAWIGDGVNKIGEGNFVLPNSFPGFDDILKTDPDNPAASVRSTIRAYSALDPTRPLFSWTPNEILPDGEKDATTTRVTGLGPKAQLANARLEPYDWDGSDDFAPLVPDWNFGGTQILGNGDFETVPMPNGGFEDGTNDYWQVTQPDGFLTAGQIIVAVKDTAASQAGDWYGFVNPGTAKSGAVRTFAGLIVGQTYTITGWMLDPTSSGDRWRAGVTGATTATHTNAYEEDGYWWAEVGNAAMGTGASTGAWQSFTLTFVAGEDQTQLVIIFDDAGAGPDFRIDSWNIVGDGVGLYPWEPRYPNRTNIFDYETSIVHSGLGSVKVQGDDQMYTSPYGKMGYGRIGIQQEVDLKVGSPYTASVWVRQDSGSPQEFVLAIIRISPLGPIGSPGSSYMAADVQTAASGVWTQLKIPFTADVIEAHFYVSWRYTGAFDTALHPSPVYYVDDAVLFEGLPETTIGDILTLIYEHAIDPDLRQPIVWDDGSATDTPYLTLDFDAALDSNGNAWLHPEIATRLTMRMSYSQIQANLSREYGYEYRVVDDDPDLGTLLWQVYNPGTMDAAPGIAVQGGATDVGRSLRRAAPTGTDQMVEGLGRVTARARDAGLISSMGRIEAATLSREAPDMAGVIEAAATANATALNTIESVEYTMVNPDDQPLTAYQLGDTVTIVDPPDIVDIDRRLIEVGATITPTGTEWVLDFGSAMTINPEAAVADAVAGLVTKFEYPFPEGGGAATPGEGIGGESTLMVAAADAPSSSINKADYFCTGTNDNEVIMAAMAEIYNAGGGRLRLTPGTFNIRADSVIVGYSLGYPLPIIAQGEGEATILNVTNAPTSWGGYVNSLSRLRDVKIQGAAMGTGSMIQCDGEIEHVLLGTAGAPIGITLANTARANDITVTGLYTAGDVVALQSCEVSSVRNTTGTSYAVVHVISGYTNVTGVRSANSVAGCAVRVTAAVHCSMTDIQSRNDENGIILDGAGFWTAQGIHITAADAIGMVLTNSPFGVFDGVIDQSGQHNLSVVDSDSSRFSGQIYGAGGDTNNTFDNINFSGTSDLNFVTGTVLRPRGASPNTRYAVNNTGSGDCNRVAGNDLGDPADYGTNALNGVLDVFWPADVTNGDNFTICNSTS